MKKGNRYRSGFETSLAHSLHKRGVDFTYEEDRFEYVGKPRHYTPDFYIPATGIYVEAKGHLTTADRMKHKAIKEQHPAVDIRFVFVRAQNKIYKGSKTTYAMWAEKNDIPWAEGSIPPEWTKE